MEPTTAHFVVKHQQFEGPLEVLLELIEKRKLFVNDISLAAVTDDFIHYIQTTGMLPDQVAHFLSVAATLILIKARSLLPTLELSTEEEQSITELERRVALYQIIVQSAGELIKKYGKKISFEGPTRHFAPVFAPDPVLTVDTLAGLIADMAGRMPIAAPKKPEARVYTTISITEVLSTLHDRIQRALSKMNFKDLAVASPEADEKSQKVYTIVSFLGMLELVRNGVIEAEQGGLFDDIFIERQQNAPMQAASELS